MRTRGLPQGTEEGRGSGHRTPKQETAEHPEGEGPRSQAQVRLGAPGRSDAVQREASRPELLPKKEKDEATERN